MTECERSSTIVFEHVVEVILQIEKGGSDGLPENASIIKTRGWKMLPSIISENSRAWASKKENAECRYCDFLLGERADRGNREPWNKIIYESDNFVVVPTLGSLVEGWLLIVTKEHFLCMGALPDTFRKEIEAVVDFTSNAITHSFNTPTIFEHGPSREGSDIGCGIDHAHLHLVPLKFSLLAQARKSKELNELVWSHSRDDFHQLQNLHRQGKSYLYIKEPNSESVYCTPEAVPCQSLRRIIARTIGIESAYDYNKYHFESNVERTIRTLQ